MYAIVDIETTGGSSRIEKITEIAIIQHDGEKITGEFSTLINPERNIPYYITSLTGITNEMVGDAPRFFEVARTIVELTEGRTIVAHNAKFDYSFIREEFKSLGYNFRRDLLDTVTLSRKLIPGHKSYSLGNICSDLGIRIEGRHRASGDALATAELFRLLMERDDLISSRNHRLIKNTRLSKLNPCLDPSKIEMIPEEPGVYYFYDEKGNFAGAVGVKYNDKGKLSSLTAFDKDKNIYSVDEMTYEYDTKGNWVKAIVTDSESGKVIYVERTYSYFD